MLQVAYRQRVAEWKPRPNCVHKAKVAGSSPAAASRHNTLAEAGLRFLPNLERGKKNVISDALAHPK